jgi:LPS-assembly protein
VSRKEPPPETAYAASVQSPQEGTAPQPTIDLSTIPHAVAVPAKPADIAVLQSNTQTKAGDLYTLSGDVEIDFRDHVLRADTVTYNAATGETTLTGNVRVSGGVNQEYIQASHGDYNVRSSTGTFYDVSGSVGLNNSPDSSHRPGFESANPFLFSGRKVVKTGPQNYDVYDGAVTSCLLPRPDWQLFSRHFVIDDKRARASNSVFRILGVPLLPLPYVTHPTDTTDRQSGILIPILGYSSASNDTGSKGLSIGEQAYLTLGRSADLTVGLLYYSLRGFSENGTVRLRGHGDDFFTAHFSALQDRGFNAPAVNAQNKPVTLYVNQGGQDLTTSFRYQFLPKTRLVGDGEYLSSYVYRQVFTENFNQSVSTDITSTLYAMNQQHGYSTDLRFDVYQGLKVVPIPVRDRLGQEIKVFHAPSLDFSADDHRIAGTPLLFSFNGSMTSVKRLQPYTTPTFRDSGFVARFDFRPELALPLHFNGWNVLASAAARETFYSKSREVPHATPPYGPNATPIELDDSLNRADVDIRLDIRPPVVERTFSVPPKFQWLLGSEVRHTLEPEIVYRDTKGINNFLGVLRFDDVDLASDTNELDYAFTQHLYFRPRRLPGPSAKPGCAVKAASATSAAGASETPSPESPEDMSPEGVALNPQSTAVEPVPQAANDANGIPNASASAPDLPTRTHKRADPCANTTLPKQQEYFSWKIQQKFFFDPSFGNAVIDQRRNIFETTLNLSGVAFLTEKRSLSPVVSRMRFRTSGHTDFEWDFDFDTGAKKINSSNVFLDVHEGGFFGGLSYALLNAPGRNYSEIINPTANNVTGVVSNATANFSQMRLLAGFNSPKKLGFSAAAGAGIDLHAGALIATNLYDTSGPLQYLTIQTSYNWNCCGVSVEYRKYDLGDIRNEGAYRFNFTLANIGTAGNIRRSESLF